MSGAKRVAEKGVVYLVGAGPGDPDLLTLKAARLLESADVVLHDDLVPADVLALANQNALLMSVGKRCGNKRITQAGIHTLMVDSARRNLSVVRLKSGDPLVFGRAGEEMQALREAGIRFEVVPGITAAFAAASTLGVSLTDRRAASKLIFATGHHAVTNGVATDVNKEHARPIWSGPLPEDATLVVYMPGRDYSSLQADLLSGGVALDMPCVAVSRAATPQQRSSASTLARLTEIDPGPAPVLLLIGRAMAGAAAADSIEGLLGSDVHGASFDAAFEQSELG
ncbi:MAG: uroporphyrinogen-III C-methyltransferase [Acidobacteriaceae bacterium]